jgi:hypothetical protein
MVVATTYAPAAVQVEVPAGEAGAGRPAAGHAHAGGVMTAALATEVEFAGRLRIAAGRIARSGLGQKRSTA